MTPTLFAPDKHSERIPSWRPLDAKSRRQAFRILKRHWGLRPGRLVTITEASHPTANSRNWRVLPARVVLKRLPARDYYPQAAAVADQLWDAGASVVRHVLSLEDSWVIEDEDHSWALTQLVGGRSYAGTPSDLVTVAEALRRLFEATKYSIVSRYLERRLPLEPEEWEILLSMAASEHQALRWHVKEVETWRDDLRALPLRVAHIDLHPHNILVNRGRATIMDAASIRVAPPVVALGYAVFKLARQAIVRQGLQGQARAEPVSILLKAIGPVEGQELLWIAAKAELLKRLAYIEAQSRRGRTDWVIDGPRHRVALDEIDVLREVWRS